ncbi:MAG: methyltransferase domain-containing protein [Rhabdochlamydiaceae bacterium]|jgi:SAM-dependent methyltransferase
MLSSISENNGLSLISDEHRNIYSVGVSTGGIAEIRMAKALASRRVIATTIDLEGANFAQNHIDQALLSDKIEVKIEDISKPLPYVDECFDFVYARLVLHYLSKNDLEKALQELYRVLKTNGKIFVVVRSTGCLEAQTGYYKAESGMTTYASKNGKTYSRYFHSQDSICNFLSNGRFDITYVKTYDEQLCVDFQRTQLSHNRDHLIEVYASKPIVNRQGGYE